MTVSILPTYSGCPAMGVIALGIETELAKAGFEDVRVVLTNTPAWTTDLMSEASAGEAAGPTAFRRRSGRLASARCSPLRRRRLPALRLARHGARFGIRLDRLQGALALPRLPRAVRTFQMHLKADLSRFHLARNRRPPAGDGGQRVGRLRRAGRASRGVRFRARPVSDHPRDDRRRGMPAVLLDLLGQRRRRTEDRGADRSRAGASRASSTNRSGRARGSTSRRPRGASPPTSARAGMMCSSPPAPASRR